MHHLMDCVEQNRHALAYDPDQVAVGRSFGNESCFIRTAPWGGLDHLWHGVSGNWYFGREALRVLQQDAPVPQVQAVFESAAMQAIFQSDTLRVEQRVFVPAGQVPRAYLWAQIRNISQASQTCRIQAGGMFHAYVSPMYRTQGQQADFERLFQLLEARPLRQNWQDYGMLQGRSTFDGHGPGGLSRR